MLVRPEGALAELTGRRSTTSGGVERRHRRHLSALGQKGDGLIERLSNTPRDTPGREMILHPTGSARQRTCPQSSKVVRILAWWPRRPPCRSDGVFFLGVDQLGPSEPRAARSRG